MMTAKEIREKADKDVEELQKICNHPESLWTEECWAPGHFTGRSLKICKICEKMLLETNTRSEGLAC